MRNSMPTDDKISKRRRYTIDEADIDGYLNTKKEALYKKMIWELLNKDYTTQKHQPKKNQKVPKPNNKKNKKVAPMNDKEMEMEKAQKKKKLASRINFDVLEKGTGDGEEDKKDEKEEEGPGKLKVDEGESGGGDGDYRDGFDEGNENNEDDRYGDYVYRDYLEEEEDGCDDNEEEYWI